MPPHRHLHASKDKVGIYLHPSPIQKSPPTRIKGIPEDKQPSLPLHLALHPIGRIPHYPRPPLPHQAYPFSFLEEIDLRPPSPYKLEMFSIQKQRREDISNSQGLQCFPPQGGREEHVAVLGWGGILSLQGIQKGFVGEGEETIVAPHIEEPVDHGSVRGEASGGISHERPARSEGKHPPPGIPQTLKEGKWREELLPWGEVEVTNRKGNKVEEEQDEEEMGKEFGLKAEEKEEEGDDQERLNEVEIGEGGGDTPYIG